MYRYDEFDAAFVQNRTAQFRDQVARRLAGEISEDQFRPLRLQNGLYLQLHAYMYRIAIPYGVLSSRQLEQLALISRRHDRGYGHFTTRTNIQFHWARLEEMPDAMQLLADVGMHSMQTSGNCIRNTTTDPYAGVAIDEIEDPRPWAEIIRQWSTVHPEFLFLPRKFKFAITGALEDRAALLFHDIAVRIVKGRGGETGFAIYAGGGQGRTPCVAQLVRGFLPKDALLSYLEAMLRVYNLHGRRDNLFKSRIKILVNSLGIEEFTRQVEEEWAKIDRPAVDLPQEEYERIAAYFKPLPLVAGPRANIEVEQLRRQDAVFDAWMRNNILPHRVPGYVIVNISLKEPGKTPGDCTAEQMEAIAALARAYGHDEIRVTYEQNLVLPNIALTDLIKVYEKLREIGLATGNHDLITDIIACPGLDYCNLANARSIPVAQEIAKRFAGQGVAEDIGRLRLNISGCINACGHHHSGNIGILGVDKKGTEHYQITLGGSPRDDASIGTILGPSFPAEEVPDAIEKIISVYRAQREDGEEFLATYRRIGAAPFKAALYGSADSGRSGKQLQEA